MILSLRCDNVKRSTNTETQLKIDIKLLRDTPTGQWIEVEHHLQLGSYVWYIFASVSTTALIQTLLMESDLF